MNRISITIRHVQHISTMTFELDLTRHKLHCLVGRNGVGKTTLVRAFRNLSNADTFIKTAGPRIFQDCSRIEYSVDDDQFVFSYDRKLRSLNCRQSIPEVTREAISAELPMPYGARFNYAKSASDADADIRAAIALKNYLKPNELINFLSSIYATNRFDRLIEVTVKSKSYYAIENDDETYIREDFLSSGEFFLISLYRTIKTRARLIVIDEIDLSLDAAAQAKLLSWLRGFCENYQSSVVFTTHSLAVMRTLKSDELIYINFEDGQVSFNHASYSYAKARLFGFSGFDRYILTEDFVLAGLIDFLIATRCEPRFFQHKIIYIGGGHNVADLLRRNQAEQFLSTSENVMAVLDGDQAGAPHATWDAVHLIPIDSVEKEIFRRFQNAQGFIFRPRRQNFDNSKEFFNHLRDERIASVEQMYEYVVQENATAFEPVIKTLNDFLILNA